MRIIAGTARSRIIEAPKGRDTRPTLDRVRENLFNILQQQVPDARVLDLFAGSGALSLEAISRGAQSAVMVDHDHAAHTCQQLNTNRLGFTSQAELLCCDWQQAIHQLSGRGAVFDLVFLDPPYAMSNLTEVTRQLRPLLAAGALVVVEHPSGQPTQVDDGLMLQDSRKYGYVGISIYALPTKEQET